MALDKNRYLAELKHGKHYYDIRKWCMENSIEIEELPYSIRVLLENNLRRLDGKFFTEEYLIRLGSWSQNYQAMEIPFQPERILLQDFTGVPAVVDIAAMRQAMHSLSAPEESIYPQIPVDLVIDHSVSMDFSGYKEALQQNVAVEFERNAERYRFLKWAENNLQNFKVHAPGQGICHQVNLEKIATVVSEEEGICYPDTVVGTDSHTTMVNSLGVLGWGVGGIEAEAAMLGQPIYMINPEVVGVRIKGKIPNGVTATDIVLYITHFLRKVKVVGKFVEYFGEGARELAATDRATIANMSPEYGATMGFFAIDEKTLDYLRLTGRAEEQVALVEEYAKKNALFRSENSPEPRYSQVVEVDLSDISPCLAGPKRPQDMVLLRDIRNNFKENYPMAEDRNTENNLQYARELARADREITHGDIVLASVTSCTNTSNPQVILGAALLAKKAVELGMQVPSYVKTSFSPGSLAVTKYLQDSGLLAYLEELGFAVAGYGCGTCIGNSGPLSPAVSKQIQDKDLQVASILSGNRNFEGRVHPLVPANYLASPILVIAFALAGRIDIDLAKEPIGFDREGKEVYFSELCPSNEEIQKAIESYVRPEVFRDNENIFLKQWEELSGESSTLYQWEETSTYVRLPNYFEELIQNQGRPKDTEDSPLFLENAKVLGIFGDSVTTDHISPAGNIALSSPAAAYLKENEVESKDFNSYGSRRGNHEVMMRGTFANIRLKNKMAGGKVGGYTMKDGELLSIYEAAAQYRKEKKDLLVIAGKEYGTGSSRDWAAKGPMLLGIKAVIAESFERIHRSNLLGMGILPLEFADGQSADSLGLTGEEDFTLCKAGNWQVNQIFTVKARKKDGSEREFLVKSRLDNEIEIDYFLNGGILNTVLMNKLTTQLSHVPWNSLF